MGVRFRSVEMEIEFRFGRSCKIRSRVKDTVSIVEFIIVKSVVVVAINAYSLFSLFHPLYSMIMSYVT